MTCLFSSSLPRLVGLVMPVPAMTVEVSGRNFRREVSCAHKR